MPVDILAFAAHRDDVELTCGGTVIKMVDRGHAVGIVDLTKGEMGTRGTAADREREALRAAEIMGVSCRENLGFPDAELRMDRGFVMGIVKKIREHRPQIVLLPPREVRHPDHGYASRLVYEAAFLAGLAKLDTGQERHRPQALICYMTRYDFTPSFVVDITDQFSRKMEAIRAYRSQFYDPESQELETPLSRPDFLEFIELRSRHYGSLIGRRYGEPFYVRETMEVDDLFQLCAGAGLT